MLVTVDISVRVHANGNIYITSIQSIWFLEICNDLLNKLCSLFIYQLTLRFVIIPPKDFCRRFVLNRHHTLFFICCVFNPVFPAKRLSKLWKSKALYSQSNCIEEKLIPTKLNFHKSKENLSLIFSCTYICFLLNTLKYDFSGFGLNTSPKGSD